MARSSKRAGRGVNRGALNVTSSVGDTFPSSPGNGHIHTMIIGSYVVAIYKYESSIPTWSVVSNGITIGTATPPTTSTYTDMLWLDTN
jgi:hypothetical protein